jgi:hypothetical protein
MFCHCSSQTGIYAVLYLQLENQPSQAAPKLLLSVTLCAPAGVVSRLQPSKPTWDWELA